MPVLSWVLIYTGGIRFSSREGTWLKAPATGVQALVMYHAAPYVTLTYGVDEFALPGQTRTKLGELLPDATFEALRQSVHRDLELWR